MEKLISNIRNNSKIFISWQFWYGLLLYSTTLVNFFPIVFFLIAICIPIVFNLKESSTIFKTSLTLFNKKKSNYLLVLIFLFSAINSYFHFQDKGLAEVIKSSYICLPLVYLVSSFIDRKVLKTLIYLTICEIFIGILQYYYGVNMFDSSSNLYEKFVSYDLFYFTRVLGLGYSSTYFSEKIFVSILLLDFLNKNTRKGFFLKIILFIGIVITFSRSILLGFYLYLLCSFFISLLNKKEKLSVRIFNYQNLYFVIIFTCSFSNLNYFKKQFTRGGMVETSGRVIKSDESDEAVSVVHNPKTKPDNIIVQEDVIEKPTNTSMNILEQKSIIQKDTHKEQENISVEGNEKDNISENLDEKRHTGDMQTHSRAETNNSKGIKNPEREKIINHYKLNSVEMSGRSEIWTVYFLYFKEHKWFGNGSKSLRFGKYHPHNSFIEIITANGILIAFLYLLFILFNLNKSNFVFIFGIMTMGLGQLSFFWPISYVDVIMYAILIRGYYIINEKREFWLSINQ